MESPQAGCSLLAKSFLICRYHEVFHSISSQKKTGIGTDLTIDLVKGIKRQMTFLCRVFPSLS